MKARNEKISEAKASAEGSASVSLQKRAGRQLHRIKGKRRVQGPQLAHYHEPLHLGPRMRTGPNDRKET